MMRNYLYILFLIVFGFLGCSDDEPNNEIIGKWQLVLQYSILNGGYYNVADVDQRIEEYTGDGERILYDYLGNEIARANYNIENSNSVVLGREEESWRFSLEFWFNHDTLVIHHDGGFEYYNEFFVRID